MTEEKESETITFKTVNYNISFDVPIKMPEHVKEEEVLSVMISTCVTDLLFTIMALGGEKKKCLCGIVHPLISLTPTRIN